MSLSVDRPEALVVRALDAERLLFPGDSSITLLADSSASQGHFSLHRAVLRPGMQGASPHHHTTAAEMFYILSGSARLLLGDRLVLANEGDVAVVPPGMPHAFAAAPGCDAEVLVAVTPGIERFELFRGLAQGLAAAVGDQSRFDTYGDTSPLWRGCIERRNHSD